MTPVWRSSLNARRVPAPSYTARTESRGDPIRVAVISAVTDAPAVAPVSSYQSTSVARGLSMRPKKRASRRWQLSANHRSVWLAATGRGRRALATVITRAPIFAKADRTDDVGTAVMAGSTGLVRGREVTGGVGHVHDDRKRVGPEAHPADGAVGHARKEADRVVEGRHLFTGERAPRRPGAGRDLVQRLQAALRQVEASAVGVGQVVDRGLGGPSHP